MKHSHNIFFPSSWYLCLFCFVVVLSSTAVAQQAEIESIEQTQTLPLIFSKGDITGHIKIEVHNGLVSFMISYSAPLQSRVHKPWIWDKELHTYGVGPSLEDSVKLFVFDPQAGYTSADVWVWRAGRTDPIGYADDMFWSSNDTERSLGKVLASGDVHADAGQLGWYSRFQSSFVGAEVKRFFTRNPLGSCADVRASGVWDRGKWEVVFSRPVHTEYDDDIVLHYNQQYVVIVAVRDQDSGLFTVAHKISFNLNRSE